MYKIHIFWDNKTPSEYQVSCLTIKAILVQVTCGLV